MVLISSLVRVELIERVLTITILAGIITLVAIVISLSLRCLDYSYNRHI